MELARLTLPRRYASTRPGHAEPGIFAENLRIEEVVVDSPINDVHALQSFRRAHENFAIFRDEIAPFDDLDSHGAGEKRMLEVSGVINAGREQNHGRFSRARRRDVVQHVQQFLAVIFHRPHAMFREKIRENTASSTCRFSST